MMGEIWKMTCFKNIHHLTRRLKVSILSGKQPIIDWQLEEKNFRWFVVALIHDHSCFTCEHT